MPTELATFVTSNPVTTQQATSLDTGSSSNQSSSGRCTRVVFTVTTAGAYNMEVDLLDQSLQGIAINGVPPAAVLTPLLAAVQALGTAKVTAAIAAGLATAGTTITFTAG